MISKKKIDQIILALGLQNLVQVGLFFPLNFVAFVYFISKFKFKIRNKLDLLVISSLFFGIISYLVFILTKYRSDLFFEVLIFNATKSFIISSFIFVYFSKHSLNLEDFYKTVLVVITLITSLILIHFIYLKFSSSFNIYQLKSQITWANGWPQRFSMFCLVGFFIFWYKFNLTNKYIYLFFSLTFMLAIFVSLTRSTIFALILTQLLTIFFSKKNFRNTIILYTLIFIILFALDINFKQYLQYLRLQEISEFTRDSKGSLGYRINFILPDIIKTADSIEFFIGRGHIGVAFQYEDEFSYFYKSLESQYIDVFYRLGLIGLIFYMLILLYGIYYTYKVYKKSTDDKIKNLLQGSLSWQIAIMISGLTVETIRLPLYALFYFLFLGILSKYYNHYIISNNRKLNNFEKNKYRL